MKKILKKTLLSIIIVVSILFVAPVVFPEIQNSYVVEAANIKINKTKKTLRVGDAYNLKVSKTNKKVKWSTSNKKVATVSSKGRVTAKKKGTATITAKVGNKKYKCKITVKDLSFSNVSITPTKLGTTLLLKLKNNNNYAVDIRIKGKFYDNKGKKVGIGEHYNFALEAKAESIMKLYCRDTKSRDRDYSSYKLSLGENNNANGKCVVTQVSRKYHAANLINIKNVTKGKNQYTIRIENSDIRVLKFVNIGIVFYDKKGKIIGAESKSVSTYYLYPHQTKDLMYNFPKNNKGKTLTPASYKVYVNYAYSYLN
ncbi:MAG: Ig domain-containing protein [Clostridia bacterium]|nr:Ig domain-containing protein [Clostridia bacterium]